MLRQDKGVGVGVLLRFKGFLFSQQRLEALVNSLQAQLVPARHAVK